MRSCVFGAVAILLTPLRILACECGAAGPACAYVNRAAIAFIGRVVFSDHDPAQGLRQRTFVKFSIEEAFKGLPPDEHEVWVDPGSFTSCYAEYPVGERFLVFAYSSGLAMPPDTSVLSIVPGQAKPKPLPKGIDPIHLPVLYAAPECSGTSSMNYDLPARKADVEYLRRFKAGAATPSIQGRVTEDATFGIFEAPPGLRGVTITVAGNGINRSVQTDGHGLYALENIPTGVYSVFSALPPYRGSRRNTEVPPMGCGVANFDMIAPGTISGALLDSNGQPAANVRVEVVRLSREVPIYYAEKEVRTDRRGLYRFKQMPSGDFWVGVNLFNAPDPETPYIATKWSAKDGSSIHLVPGEQKQVPVFRLPPPSAVRKIEAEVHWPDGRPAQGVTVWGEVGDRAATSGQTDENGLARLDVLEGIPYAVEAKIWIGSGGQREVARSGATILTPGPDPIHLKLVLGKRTKNYR